MKSKNNLIASNKSFAYLGVATLAILAVPFTLMQFTSEVDWEFVDFLVMGIIIFGVSFAIVHVTRVIPSKYRILVGIGFFTLFLLIWAHLAVGIVNTWPLAGS